MNRGRWALLAVAIALVAIVGVVWMGRGRSAAPEFRTAEVEKGSVESVVSATGNIRPVIQVEVGSQVSGIIHRIHADFNSRVKAGQVLCEIEPSSFQARVVQNQAAVDKAEVMVKDAKRVLGRQSELAKQNYISQAEVEAGEVAVEQRQAELSQARAQLQVAAVDLKNTVIRAPIDGVVIARSIDLGQTVAASLQAPKLFVIANDLANMQVETRIDEADIGRIRPGLPATFTVDAYADMSFQGEVSQVRLEPIVEQGVVTYTTVIRTGNPGLRLKPGMTANVSVLVAKRDDVLKVPAAALRFRPPTRNDRGGGAQATAATLSGGGRAAGGARTSAFADSGASRTGQGGRAMNRTGAAGRGQRGGPNAGRTAGEMDAVAPERPRLRPGVVYKLHNGKPERTEVMTGISDGAWVEVQSDKLQVGDDVIVSLDVALRGGDMQAPPGMGGRGGGGGGRGGRR